MNRQSSLADYSVNSLSASEIAWLPALFQAGSRNNYPVVLWRKPGAENKEGFLASNLLYPEKYPDIAGGEKGFVISPFDNPGGQYSLFLKDGIYFSSDKDTPEHTGNGLPTNLEKELQGLLEQNAGKSEDWPVYNGEHPSESDQEQFQAMIREALQQIKQEKVEKIVSSRIKRVSLSKNFDPVAAFKRLCESYPGAFVYLIALPDYGTWLGATPELLLGYQQQGLFKSIALAGTQPARDERPENVAWTQKEIAEQAMVSRFIINCFKHIRLRNFKESGPKTVQAGNLMHLMTEYQVDTQQVDFPNLPNTMLELLHPTSAVCGIPREPAKMFIAQQEPHERALYSGFLGPVNFEGNTQLYVNLRCMQLLHKEALLYAGAGITADSVPEKEWEETEVKCETLLRKVFK